MICLAIRKGASECGNLRVKQEKKWMINEDQAWLCERWRMVVEVLVMPWAERLWLIMKRLVMDLTMSRMAGLFPCYGGAMIMAKNKCIYMLLNELWMLHFHYRRWEFPWEKAVASHHVLQVETWSSFDPMSSGWPGTVKAPDELTPINIHQWRWWIWIMIMIKFVLSITRVGETRQRDSPMVNCQDLSGWLCNRQMISSATRDRHSSYAYYMNCLRLPIWLHITC